MKQIALTDKTGDYSRKLEYICKKTPKKDKKAMTYSRVIRELIEARYYELKAKSESK